LTVFSSFLKRRPTTAAGPVVKVVVPGLEGYRFESYSPGRRATAFAALPVR